MNEIIDTLLNIVAFGFIGGLVWIYLKPDKASSREADKDP